MAKKVKNPRLYRSLHHLRKGGLHRALGISENEVIPKSKVEAATHSENKHLAQMARFAQTMGKWNKK